jgi:hypothetical protein
MPTPPVDGTQNVTLTLQAQEQANGTTKYCILFIPDTVEGDYHHRDTITWTVNTTTFPGATINSLDFTPANSSFAVSGLGTNSVSIIDDDENTTGQNQQWNYTMSVTWDGQTYTTDPKIINKPDRN